MYFCANVSCKTSISKPWFCLVAQSKHTTFEKPVDWVKYRRQVYPASSLPPSIAFLCSTLNLQMRFNGNVETKICLFHCTKKSFLKSRNKYLRNKCTLFGFELCTSVLSITFRQTKKATLPLSASTVLLNYFDFCSVISIFTPKITALVKIFIDYRKQRQVYFSKNLLLKTLYSTV